MSIPNTLTRTWYSYTINMNGQEVGTLQSFNVTSNMDIERVRQILYSAGARVLELVPGAVNISVSVERVLMYQKSLFQAIGRNVFSIEDVLDPFEIVEVGRAPTGASTVIHYMSCLFSDVGKNINTGQVLVTETATIQVSTIRGYMQ